MGQLDLAELGKKQEAGHLLKVKERLATDSISAQIDIHAHIGRYVFASEFVNGKTVLDIACGTAYGANYLLKKGAVEVFGGDISEESIEYAVARYQKEGLRFLVMDAQRLPLPDDYFDVVISLETIEHVNDAERFLLECKRVLKSDGIFVRSTPNKEAVKEAPPSPHHLQEFTTEELHHLLNGYFRDIKLYGYIIEKKQVISQKLIGGIKAIVFSLPGVLQIVIMKLAAIIGTFALRKYRPVKLEDVDGNNFDDMLSDEFKPFPISVSPPICPQSLIVVGQKVGR